jgi:hypothetical protein
LTHVGFNPQFGKVDIRRNIDKEIIPHEIPHRYALVKHAFAKMTPRVQPFQSLNAYDKPLLMRIASCASWLGAAGRRGHGIRRRKLSAFAPIAAAYLRTLHAFAECDYALTPIEPVLFAVQFNPRHTDFGMRVRKPLVRFPLQSIDGKRESAAIVAHLGSV